MQLADDPKLLGYRAASFVRQLPADALEAVLQLSDAFLALPRSDRPRLKSYHRAPPSVEAHVAATLNADGIPCPLRDSRRWYRSDVRSILEELHLHGRSAERREARAERETARERARRAERARVLREAIPPPPPLPDHLLKRAQERGALLRQIRADLDGLDAATGGPDR